MPRETFKARAARLKKIIAALDRTYPEVHCELDHSDPLELLIATILSAQCTDKRVNIVTQRVVQKIPLGGGLRERPLAELEQAIKTTGFFRNKAKNIKAAAAYWSSFMAARSRKRWRN